MASKEYHRRYYERNKEKIKTQSRRLYFFWRNECITKYGGKCKECGITEYVVLDIDHIDNNGAEHRKTFKNSIYKHLADLGYPEGYQVLCANCHRRKTAKWYQER